MDKERMAESEKIEAHGAENGWVAPMTEEDRAFFAYFRSVFKRYNISPSKATRPEYDFVTRVAESEFLSPESKYVRLFFVYCGSTFELPSAQKQLA